MTTAVGTAKITPNKPPILAPVKTEINAQTGFNPVKLPKILGPIKFSRICCTITAAINTLAPIQTSCSDTNKVVKAIPTEPP